MSKKFVLDTSVLLYDYEALFKFEENEVIIPSIVFEEINKFKEELTERGYIARRVLEVFEELAKVRPLLEGVKLSEINPNSTLYPQVKGLNTIIRRDYNIYSREISKMLVMSENDYNIIASALNNEAILVSRDRGMRVIGSDFVKVEDYEADMIKTKEIYKGYREVVVDENIINSLYENKLIDIFDLCPNEFIILKNNCNPNHTGVGIKKGNRIIPCDFKNMNCRGRKVNPINLEQKMLMYLLLDEDIKCVTVTGVSGKGKSLLSIDYALASVNNFYYNEFLYTKSVISVDKREDLGFYKGGLDDKLKPHLQPLYSSIEFLYKDRLGKGKERQSLDSLVNELINNNILSFYPLANIRGMSIYNKIVMLDEAQNTTNHMIKSLVTRVSDNSKLIIAGDVEQIDDRNLNKYNNGLVHLIEAGKEEDFIGHICMDIDNGSRRGQLAEFGSRKL